MTSREVRFVEGRLAGAAGLLVAALLVAGLLAAGCSTAVSAAASAATAPAATTSGATTGGAGTSGTGTGSSTTGSSGSGSSVTPNTVSNTGLDETALPLGDGNVGSTPRAGTVYSCQTTFAANGGASVVGPWVNTTAATFNMTAKTVVSGEVAWPSAAYTITLNGSTRDVSTNDLPNHTTGVFPIAFTDPAHQYDGNPNQIGAQTVVWSLPADPVAAASPSCVPMGPIGITLTGAVLFNALDAAGRDAVAHEEQDHCQGHPDRSSEYHYHSLTTCLADPGTGHSNLLGYALDGFGIYGVRGEDGKPLTNADLDACHGHTHAITWDGKTVVMYHYHATNEYPYTIGCFHGTPVSAH